MATTNGHPATPPSDPSATSAPTAPTLPPPQQETLPDPDRPLTIAEEDPDSKKPRDARLIHTILAAQGITNYQQRVPLQLLDFAYRYTSSVLSDSLRLAAEGYASQNPTSKRGGGGDDAGNITVPALRQAIASRNGYTFQGPLPKDFMLEQAGEKNRVALPRVERGFGVQLPPEKYCLTGVGWGLKNEWESDEEVEVQERPQSKEDDEKMGGVEEDEDEEGAGRMEDVFGETGDTTMAD